MDYIAAQKSVKEISDEFRSGEPLSTERTDEIAALAIELVGDVVLDIAISLNTIASLAESKI